MRITEDDHEWRDRLSASLARFATEAEAADLRVHLGDLREGCVHAINLIERLAVLDVSVDPLAVRTTLAHLKGELLYHMLPHIQDVAPGLTSVVSKLYADAEERGEFDDG